MAICRISIFIKYKANFVPVRLGINIRWIEIWNNIRLLVTCCPKRCLSNSWFYSFFIFSKKAVNRIVSSWNSFISFLITSQKSCFGIAFLKTFQNSSLPMLFFDFNCKPTDCIDSFGTCMLAGVHVSWISYDWGFHRYIL